jgi:transcriptional regulator with XRE-family HTH domain
MIDTEVVSKIAQKMKAVRLEKGMTIQNLCDRTSLSKGLISKIENSRTIPSMPVFVNLIQALGVPLKDFFEDLTYLIGKDYIHVKAKDYSTIKKEDRPGFNYLHILSQSIGSCTLESAILTLDGKTSGKPTITDGFEYKYILRGTCEYTINSTKIVLEEGDSLFFDASKPHFPSNQSKQKVVMLVLYFLMLK